MSVCSLCGAEFGCAMADGLDAPCWCLDMPPVVAVPAPGGDARCWCPACLKLHVESLKSSPQLPARD